MSNALLAGENASLGGGQRQTRWLTPPEIVGALGRFDLDPCGAPYHELATRTYLPESGQDGLSLPWEGRVWLNPPYGRKAAAFVARMAQHNHGTALLFARTETDLFHRYVWPVAQGLLFLRRRITFLRADGTPASANSGAPSVLIAYGQRDAEILSLCILDGHYVALRGLNQ